MKFILNVICLLTLLQLIESSRILGIFPTPSKSHVVAGQAVLRELAVRGHDVSNRINY